MADILSRICPPDALCYDPFVGSGTTIMLGDWSRVPNFLFPYGKTLQLGYGAPPQQPSSIGGTH